MAYSYTSNNPEVLDNYQYYQHHYNNYYYYDSINHDSRYVHQYYYDPQLFSGNPYQHAPNPSFVGYYYSNYYQSEALNKSKNASFHENGDEFFCYNEPVLTEYIISYNVKDGGEAQVEAEVEAITDIDFEEYNPEPFHGGYDIHATYGKPLPPSEKICYPNSKNDYPSNNDGSSALPDPPQTIINGGKKVENGDEPKQSNGVISSKVIQDEEVEDDDDYDDDEYDDDYDDDEYDDDDDEGVEEEGGKQDDLGKEVVMVAPIASLGDANHDENVGEKKSSNGTKKVRFDDEVIVHGNDQNQNQNPNLGEVIQGKNPTKLQNKQEEKEEEENLKEEEKKEDENGSEMMQRQIPPGYGMETLDLCEGIFGGYFPCFWKKYQRNNNNQESDVKIEKIMSDYEYCCKDTVDYLFGNPNPYGGMMQEKGSYGDPVYSYQRYYPQQTVTHHVDYYGGHSSGFQTSNYNYYGNNNNDYYYH